MASTGIAELFRIGVFDADGVLELGHRGIENDSVGEHQV